MKLNKKGNIDLMVPFAISFIVVVIVIALGGTMLTTFQAGQLTGAANCNATSATACGMGYNISSSGLTGIKTFGDFLPTIAIVLVVAVIIGIIVTYLYSKFGNQ